MWILRELSGAVRFYAHSTAVARRNTSGCVSGLWWGLRRDSDGLSYENIENALANVASSKMLLFPWLQDEPPNREIEKPAILNVHLNGWVVHDVPPDRRELAMIWTIRKCRS